MSKPRRRTLENFAIDRSGEAFTGDIGPRGSASNAGKAEKSRQQLPTYIPNNAYEQLRKLAFEERISMNALILEGLDLLFRNRGLKSISELIDM